MSRRTTAHSAMSSTASASRRNTTSGRIKISGRSTVHSSRVPGKIFVCVAEGRALDIGVAWLSLEERGYVNMSTISDGHTLSQTLAFLRMLNPSDILLSEVRKVWQLFLVFRSSFPNFRLFLITLLLNKHVNFRMPNSPPRSEKFSNLMVLTW